MCSLLRNRLNVFVPPLPEVGCPKKIKDSESLGKSNGKKCSNIGKFLIKKVVQSPHKEKVCFLANFARIRRSYNKDQEVIQQGSGGYATRIGRLLALVERCFVSRMQDFLSRCVEALTQLSIQKDTRK